MRTISKLAYIADARMPTERAHGLQIIRMCEAFSRLGVHVTLFYPCRVQTNPSLRGRDIFKFFGVQTPFEIHRIPNLDPLSFQTYIGGRLSRWFSRMTRLAFGLLSALYSRRHSADVYFTREWLVAWWLIRLGLPTVFEAHTVFEPPAIGRKALSKLGHDSSLRLMIAVTQGIMRDLATSGVPRGKMIVLPDAVDIHHYEKPLTGTEARRKVGLPRDASLVVYTGSLFPGKGVYVLAESTRYLNNATVVLIGSNPGEQEEMRHFIQEHKLENILVWGHVPPPEVPVFQQAADVLALPQLGVDTYHLHYTSPLKGNPIRILNFILFQ